MSDQPDHDQTRTLSRVDLPRLVVPLSIWLQWYGDGDPDDGEPESTENITWCADKIFPEDIEYVHAGEIRRALMGHRLSELWGDNGLIAATMRCVEAVGKIEDIVTTDHESKEALIGRVRDVLRHNAKLTQSEEQPTN